MTYSTLIILAHGPIAESRQLSNLNGKVTLCLAFFKSLFSYSNTCFADTRSCMCRIFGPRVDHVLTAPAVDCPRDLAAVFRQVQVADSQRAQAVGFRQVLAEDVQPGLVAVFLRVQAEDYLLALAAAFRMAQIIGGAYPIKVTDLRNFKYIGYRISSPDLTK